MPNIVLAWKMSAKVEVAANLPLQTSSGVVLGPVNRDTKYICASDGLQVPCAKI